MSQRKIKSSHKKYFSLDQCSLYKVRSKKRLCEVLLITPAQLKKLSVGGEKNYHQVEIPEERNELTGKTKKARSASVPNFFLKKVHSRIHALLSSITPPGYAHGSIGGRSYITNALSHVGSDEVLTMDLRDFFRSVKRNRVFYFFRDMMCCSSDVAGILSNLLTYQGALPIGSPASAILAMWSCKSMFDKMSALATSDNLRFSTFVDDVSFSGSKIPKYFLSSIKRLCSSHGFSIHEKKTRFFKYGSPALITGIILVDGGIAPTYSRFCGIRKLSTIISREGKSSSVNGKSVKYSLRGLRLEAKYIESLQRLSATRLLD